MNHKSPFVASIVDLPHQEGSVRDYDFEFLTPDDFGTEMFAVETGSALTAHLSFASVQEGVFVSGSARALAHGRCSRCLREFTVEMNEQVAEIVYYPERIAALIADGDEEAEDFPVVQDDAIDLEPILRDALVLAMPFTPLCEPDCEGLCAGCGKAWRDLPDDHHHEDLDPRFAALDGLLAQLSAHEEGDAYEEGSTLHEGSEPREES